MDNKTRKHILNVLRRGTVTWHGRSECLRSHRKEVFEGRRHLKTGKKIYKYFYQCQKCKTWYRDQDDLEVDHIDPVGKEPRLEEFDEKIAEYISRMYCEQDNLQPLCVTCHKKKSSKGNARDRYVRKPISRDDEED